MCLLNASILHFVAGSFTYCIYQLLKMDYMLSMWRFVRLNYANMYCGQIKIEPLKWKYDVSSFFLCYFVFCYLCRHCKSDLSPRVVPRVGWAIWPAGLDLGSFEYIFIVEAIGSDLKDICLTFVKIFFSFLQLQECHKILVFPQYKQLSSRIYAFSIFCYACLLSVSDFSSHTRILIFFF